MLAAADPSARLTRLSMRIERQRSDGRRGHPKVAFLGMRLCFPSGAHRISNETAGKRVEPLMTALTPVAMAALPAHVHVSWGELLTDHGPVYLEGNLYPPGCDDKRTIFKTWADFRHLRDRRLGASR